MSKYLNKGISTPIAIAIILLFVASVGGITLWQYSEMQKEELELSEMETLEDAEEEKTGEGAEAKPSGIEIIENENNTKKTVEDSETEIYNHAGRIIKIYEEDGKQYLNINLIKFLLFLGQDENPSHVYGENDEVGNCKPIADPYCIVDNDKTVNSYEVSKNIIVIPDDYPGDPVPYERLETLIITGSPFFRFQIENHVIKKIEQIYVP